MMDLQSLIKVLRDKFIKMKEFYSSFKLKCQIMIGIVCMSIK